MDPTTQPLPLLLIARISKDTGRCKPAGPGHPPDAPPSDALSSSVRASRPAVFSLERTVCSHASSSYALVFTTLLSNFLWQLIQEARPGQLSHWASHQSFSIPSLLFYFCPGTFRHLSCGPRVFFPPRLFVLVLLFR